MTKMKLLAIILVCTINFHINTALKCYMCSYTETASDRSCIDDVTTTTIKNCNKKYCTSQRNEYLDPEGKVASMLRTCEDDPTNKNTVIEDGTYRIYYVACTSDLCNGGTGKQTSSNTAYLGDKSTIICPGIGSGSNRIILSKVILFLIVVIICVIY